MEPTSIVFLVIILVKLVLTPVLFVHHAIAVILELQAIAQLYVFAAMDIMIIK